MNTQLVVHNQSVQDIEVMARAAVKSGLFGVKNQDQAVALMLLAQSEQMHPFSVCAQFDIIQGRPALKSQAGLARFQAAGGKIQWLERTDTKASAKFSHPSGGDLVVTWTIEQAKAAGLTGKQSWVQYSRAMLSARVVAEGVRAIFPACLNGVYLAEEVQDFDAKPRQAKEPVEIVLEAPEAKEVPSLPEPPKEAPNNEERPTQGEVVEAEIAWEGNWWIPEVEAALDPIADKVNAFLIGREKIKEGQGWRDVSDETYRKNINGGLPRFLKAVEGKK